MKLTNDDDVRRVNSVFLGPKGWLLPWTARYVAYGMGAALFFALFLVERQLGYRSVPWAVIWPLFLAIAATRWLGERISFDVRFRDVVKIAWHELNAPRPLAKGHTATLAPTRIRRSPIGKEPREHAHR